MQQSSLLKYRCAVLECGRLVDELSGRRERHFSFPRERDGVYGVAYWRDATCVGTELRNVRVGPCASIDAAADQLRVRLERIMRVRQTLDDIERVTWVPCEVAEPGWLTRFRRRCMLALKARRERDARVAR